MTEPRSGPLAPNRRLTTRRLERLREELDDAGISLTGHDVGADAVLEEVDYARFPPVHEGSMPSYGAVLTSSRVRADDLGGHSYSASPGDLGVLRRLADGRHSFVLRRAKHIELLLLSVAHDREAELVHLRHQTAGMVVIVQRTAHGAVRILDHQGLFVWDGAHWWDKPYAGSYAQAVMDTVDDAPPEPLRAILDFCVHTMSPSDSGATLVWHLETEGLATAGLNPAVTPISVPRLPLQDPGTHAAIRQLLGQVDGAAVLGAEAHVVAVGAHLRGSQRSNEFVRVDPAEGTRHASARRFSFDHDRAVVFAVSKDGPVTVYAHGAVVASIRSRPDQAQTAPGTPPPRRGRRRMIDCVRCGKRLAVDPGPTPTRSNNAPVFAVECPVCGQPHEVAGPGTVLRVSAAQKRETFS